MWRDNSRSGRCTMCKNSRVRRELRTACRSAAGTRRHAISERAAINSRGLTLHVSSSVPTAADHHCSGDFSKRNGPWEQLVESTSASRATKLVFGATQRSCNAPQSRRRLTKKSQLTIRKKFKRRPFTTEQLVESTSVSRATKLVSWTSRRTSKAPRICRIVIYKKYK
ncbi:unnamed protein product [Trichogramma brassicae]|uniref:Uncharacterized protein n=1 Tax=Trichogramma brassicae TaxID=86971 RepID=A0A6H5J0R2_9HYME|nr:unnamed protein product [Trichogramma brassicae]